MVDFYGNIDSLDVYESAINRWQRKLDVNSKHTELPESGWFIIIDRKNIGNEELLGNSHFLVEVVGCIVWVTILVQLWQLELYGLLTFLVLSYHITDKFCKLWGQCIRRFEAGKPT